MHSDVQLFMEHLGLRCWERDPWRERTINSQEGRIHFNMLKQKPTCGCLSTAAWSGSILWKGEHSHKGLLPKWLQRCDYHKLSLFSAWQWSSIAPPYLILSSSLPMVAANKRWLERSCESTLNTSSRAWCAPHPSLACLTTSRPPHGLLYLMSVSKPQF